MKIESLGTLLIFGMLAAAAPNLVVELQRRTQPPADGPSDHWAQAAAVLGAERGLRYLVESPSIRSAIQHGVAPQGLDFDVEYAAGSSTRYAVRLTSGPAAGEVTVTGAGEDLSRGIVRVVSIVYALAPKGPPAVVSMHWTPAHGAIEPAAVAAVGPRPPRR